MLQVENIHTFYGKIEILKGVSLRVEKGEIITLVGANGAGKTTLLKTLSGLLHPADGRITFLEKDISRTPAHEVVGLGLGHVPEGRKIFPRLSVFENLEMGAFYRKDHEGMKENLDRIFTLFPLLAERKSQLGGTLSGGEQQMLAIGRALMGSPSLLMLDEPSMGLSPVLMEKIFQTIRDINREGATILLVEQNVNVALHIANRGYVLETGRVVLEDNAKSLLNNPLVKEAYLGCH